MTGGASRWRCRFARAYSRHRPTRAQRPRSVLTRAPPPAPVRAKLHRFPVARPFLAPRERQAAGSAGLRRQVALLDHLRHRHFLGTGKLFPRLAQKTLSYSYPFWYIFTINKESNGVRPHFAGAPVPPHNLAPPRNRADRLERDAPPPGAKRKVKRPPLKRLQKLPPRTPLAAPIEGPVNPAWVPPGSTFDKERLRLNRERAASSSLSAAADFERAVAKIAARRARRRTGLVANRKRLHPPPAPPRG